MTNPTVHQALNLHSLHVTMKGFDIAFIEGVVPVSLKGCFLPLQNGQRINAPYAFTVDGTRFFGYHCSNLA